MVRATVVLLASLVCVSGCSSQVEDAAPSVTVFEGARLITGDDNPPSEDSAFAVEDGLFTAVGRRGERQVPDGAERIDLTGKTIMPAKVDLHGHLGFQRTLDQTMAKEYYTRENLIDHLERLAYYATGEEIWRTATVPRPGEPGGDT